MNEYEPLIVEAPELYKDSLILVNTEEYGWRRVNYDKANGHRLGETLRRNINSTELRSSASFSSVEKSGRMLPE